MPKEALHWLTTDGRPEGDLRLLVEGWKHGEEPDCLLALLVALNFLEKWRAEGLTPLEARKRMEGAVCH